MLVVQIAAGVLLGLTAFAGVLWILGGVES